MLTDVLAGARLLAMPRVALVTALLPPLVGGTEILLWRLFRGDPNFVVVSGAPANVTQPTGVSDEIYRAFEAPTLSLPYPHLRGYRCGLAPLLGAASTAWLAWSLPRVVRFLRQQGVSQVVSVTHNGPFALLGYLAARRLGLEHTFYILDAWEEALTGPVEVSWIRAGLRRSARAPRSKLAVVSPALGAHYRSAFGFQSPLWIPNPAPAPDELPTTPSPQTRPFVLFTGGIKSFNVEVLRRVVRAMSKCRVAEKLVVTGHASSVGESALGSAGAGSDRIELRAGTRAEVARLQREAAALLVATNADDRSATALGYLPGRLPEYVASQRPILVLGPDNSDAARAVRHWDLGRTASGLDESELPSILDAVTYEGLNPTSAQDTRRDLFLEIFSREEARHRLLGDTPPRVSAAARALAASFEAYDFEAASRTADSQPGGRFLRTSML